MDIDFNHIQQKCQQTEQKYSQRNSDDDEIERMYLMKWTAPEDERLTVTISPSARNAAKGAIRLLTAASPIFSVPYDRNSPKGRKASDKVEQAAGALWFQSSRATQRLIEREAMTTAALFDEIHIGVTLTSDLVAAATNDPANKARMERLAAMTPVVFEVYDPRTGYPEFDNYGLVSYYRKVETTAGVILDRWGEAAEAAGCDPRQRDASKYYCDYWDSTYHMAWIEGASAPLLAAEHGLPCIPIVCQLIDGSYMHDDPEYQRQGLLYTLYKSGLWQRMNLLLTIMYSNVLGIGANPMFQGTTTDPDHPPRPDFSIPGGTLWQRPGESWGAVQRNVIDQSLMSSFQLGAQEIEASTIFSQALGQPLAAGNAPFSSVALLNQAGRLPLTAMQKLGGVAFGKAMEIALLLIKSNGKSAKLRIKGSVLDLKPTDIPDDLIIDCKLDIALPTDERQNAMVAAQLTGGDSPIVSRRWARENLLNIGQSEDMQREIAEEEFVTAKIQIELQKRIQQAQMDAQMDAQGGPGQVQVPPGAIQGSPQPEPEGMAPEMAGAGLPAMPMTAPGTPEGMPEEPVPPGSEMMGGM